MIWIRIFWIWIWIEFPVTTSHHKSPPVTTSHHQSLPVTTSHHQSLPVTTSHQRVRQRPRENKEQWRQGDNRTEKVRKRNKECDKVWPSLISSSVWSLVSAVCDSCVSSTSGCSMVIDISGSSGRESCSRLSLMICSIISGTVSCTCEHHGSVHWQHVT